MEELRDRLVAVTGGAARERLSVYSAHDYTLLPLLIGLNIMPGECLDKMYCTVTYCLNYTAPLCE
jgi:hypothetical protein